MLYFKFNEEKALAAILYIAKKLIEEDIKAGLHKVFKVFYFADQKHLSRYGRPITGDYYVAMEHGPVPSRIYDMVKTVRGDSLLDTEKYKSYFDVKGHDIYPKRAPDIDEFSESDLECLDEALEENKRLHFSTLKQKSHDSAYRKAQKDDKIPFQSMAQVAGADKEMLEYIQNVSENERLFLSK